MKQARLRPRLHRTPRRNRLECRRHPAGLARRRINDLGRRQAYELVAALSQAKFSLVCSSPLARSLETAEIIARSLRLPPPVCIDGLKERNFGVIQGVPKAELAELNPVLLQQIMRRNPAADFEQGETMDEFADRILAALHFIGRHYPGSASW
jgi:probable phosphoglycerate mutase